MSSPVHIYNGGKYHLILGKGPTQGIDDTTLTAETSFLINFFRLNRKICLSCNTVGATVLYLLMLQKYISSKQNILKWKSIPCV